MLKPRIHRLFCPLWIALAACMFIHEDALAEKRSHMQLLFVVNATKATMTPQKENHIYHITMDAEKVYYFSQRPERRVGLISMPVFLEYWNKKSKDNFYTDHPNAAFTGVSATNASQQLNLILEMKNPQYDAKTHTFSFNMKLLRGEMRATQLKDITLFIDAIPTGPDSGWGNFSV